MKNLKRFLVSFFVEMLFRLLRLTWRIKESELPAIVKTKQLAGETVTYAHWHQDEWALLGAFAGREMAVLVSDSADGSAMARVLENLGFRVLRGSSSRNAVRGFLQLIRAVRKEKLSSVSLAVDGPRGPRFEPKEGIVKLAEAFGGVLIVGAAAADRAWVFHKSWSQAFVPKPFARISVAYLQLGEAPSVEAVKKTLHQAKQLARKNVEAPRQ